MPVVLHAVVASETFEGGASYQTLVGDSQGTTPLRIGIQTSPPGYRTPMHSHPYLEVITVLEGQGEAWMEEFNELIPLKPEVTLIVPPNVRHWFRALGSKPLKLYGIHASPHRIVQIYQDVDGEVASPSSLPAKFTPC